MRAFVAALSPLWSVHENYATIATVALLSACASPMMMPVDNAALPEPVRVPAGQKMVMVATGVGDITY
jgi:hypothetical protein